ncbi:BRISC and BRCA1-A complex member 2-like [Ceratina calcarata]|uniref:BRISC and BRCA1-A complex member 2 n=1 Tax=Ceratina calcarata TaxID=156304 RepID=A0AAJ7N7P6_9HYME|nr:BRISC and BRCA1-A complex member 2-like [Ceratina calcarata]
MLNQQYAVHPAVDSHIKPLLMSLSRAKKLDISCGTIEIDPMTSSCGDVKADRFKLSVPYCKQNLTWNVFFDSQCPDMGPDFIFNDNNFLSDMDINTLSAKIPSLAAWNPTNKDALLNVLIELLSCYKKYQIQLMHKEARLSAEYNMLMGSIDVKLEDVEVVLLPFGFKPTEARFVISLSVNVSQLQMYNFETEIETAILLVTFSGADWSRIVPQLYFSKSLEEILIQRTGPLNMPPFPADQYLLNYVEEIKKYISDKVNCVVQMYDKRIEYITAFTSLRRLSIIEVDVINYNYAVCLIDQNDFHCIIHIKLPLEFPTIPPLVRLESPYHMISPTDSYYEIVENYPYNVHWSPRKMITQLTQFICRFAINRFKCNVTKPCSKNNLKS